MFLKKHREPAQSLFCGYEAERNHPVPDAAWAALQPISPPVSGSWSLAEADTAGHKLEITSLRIQCY